MDAIDRWNARYRDGERGSGTASPLLMEAVKGLAPGRALDLACGLGRNALYLAEHAWSVTAVDGSTVAIDIVRTLHPRIEALTFELEHEPLPFADNSFDLVCLIHFLHRPLFDQTRRILRPRGVIVAAIHTVRSTMNPAYTVGLGELRGYFNDWEIVVDREDEIAELVARKQ